MFMFSGWLSQTFPLRKKNTLTQIIMSKYARIFVLSLQRRCLQIYAPSRRETNVHSISHHPSPPCDQPAAQRGSSGFICRMGRNIQKHPLTVMFLFQPVKPATQPEKNIKNS